MDNKWLITHISFTADAFPAHGGPSNWTGYLNVTVSRQGFSYTYQFRNLTAEMAARKVMGLVDFLAGEGG